MVVGQGIKELKGETENIHSVIENELTHRWTLKTEKRADGQMDSWGGWLENRSDRRKDSQAQEKGI